MMQKLSKIVALLGGSAFLLALVAKYALGIVINTSPSASPVGIYRPDPNFSGLTKGDLVSVCLPHDWAVFAQQRGYIGGGGPCADQSMPLVKQIGAIGGDPINIEPETIQHIDSHGRPMPEFIVGAYIVPKGMVWLYGNEPRSFDSKYYGPVPESNVLALLKPVITW